MAKKKNASSSSAQAAVVDEKPATVVQNGTPKPMASPTKKAAPAAPSGPGLGVQLFLFFLASTSIALNVSIIFGHIKIKGNNKFEMKCETSQGSQWV